LEVRVVLGIRVFLPALAAVVCALACPAAQGQTELLPLPGGTAPATLPGVPFRPQGYALGIYRAQREGRAEDAPPADSANTADIVDSLRAIAEAAPNVKSTVFLPAPPEACALEDDACLSRLGASQQLDLMVVGALTQAGSGRTLEVRLIDVAGRKRLSQAQQAVASTDRAELEARAEAMGCALLIPGGCRGTALVDLDLPEMQLIVDGTPHPRGDEGETKVELALPVGLHRIRVAAGQRTSPERTLLVLRKPDVFVALYGRQLEQGGLSLLSREDLPLALDGTVAAPRSQRTTAAPRWIRPAGYAAAGLGVLALALGGYELQHGKSLANTAAAAYDSNGGYYRPGDLGTVNSSRSATSAGRVAGLAGLGLLAASAALVFAF
jgi:hypothetical protein